MKALIQRVSQASVAIAGNTVATIDAGLLVLVGFEPDDTPAIVAQGIRRCIAYRVFADSAGRMNRALQDQGGGLLLVPQFTLAADTRSGLRPGFSTSALPDAAKPLFEVAVASAREALGSARVAQGVFGADMAVSLTNDGPVTFWLTSPPAAGQPGGR